jgi:hypothetical protein
MSQQFKAALMQRYQVADDDGDGDDNAPMPLQEETTTQAVTPPSIVAAEGPIPLEVEMEPTKAAEEEEGSKTREAVPKGETAAQPTSCVLF